MKEISNSDLEKITGGKFSMANPVACVSEEEAEKIAAELGDGKDMGSWTTMSGEQFMKWWESTHKSPDEPIG